MVNSTWYKKGWIYFLYYLGFLSIIGVSTRSLFIVNYTIFHMSKHEKGKIGVTIPVFGNGSEDIN